MKRSHIPVCIDLLFCLVIMPPIIMLVPVDKWMVHHSAFMLTLITYLYGLYFVYRKTKLPLLFMQRKFGRILLMIALLVGVTFLLTHFPYLAEPENIDPFLLKTWRHLRSQMVWFFFLIVTGFSLSIELIFELFHQVLSRQETEAEKNKAQLALYKAQINPHFLFNTLNTLYGLVLTQSDKTESAFVKFSDILKYMYTQTAFEVIPVSQEVEYIRQYVDLQSLRLNRHSQVKLETWIEDGQVEIPPMILITFVENAFKYGVSPDTDCFILLHITVKEGQLLFETENRVMKENRTTPHAMGIENCRKRLELLYPGRYELVTKEEEGLFTVRLTIQLR
ncbi:histidine kinase [Parabacteroides distasonis]|uniref:Histidine kinase n=2 Tax=Parabacteroides distasonis TaxID=823 RepID=A0A1Y4IJX2_PARDI|nr:sensor histidine kinase [Parabacteroides distasonis]OUP20628.1 histidine kinase [Parabacteroides distasonis]